MVLSAQHALILIIQSRIGIHQPKHVRHVRHLRHTGMDHDASSQAIVQQWDYTMG